MKKLILPALIILNALNYSSAQEPLPYCGTVYPTEEQMQQDPALRQRVNALEEFTKSYTESYESFKVQQPATYVIPVVIHVMHTYTSNFISDAQVHDAIRILNEDFRKLNADTNTIHSAFQTIAADSDIEFRLARLDPNGNCTNGITRTYTPLTLNAGDNVKSLVIWDATKYMNVWVVQNIASPGVAAYAYHPSNGNQAVDGIVTEAAYFGSMGTGSPGGSRTLTHEVGHYLNLKHTWGGTNSPGVSTNCNDDDLVSDTPNTIGNTNCNTNAISCGSLDNVQNYMEYSFCSRMFTEGQKVRMHAALNSFSGGRNNLWTPANHLVTGTNDGFAASPCIPVADFKANETFICEGSSVSFTNFSWKSDSMNYSWSFPGGTPSTSNLANPVITYNTAGVYSVTLTVSNVSGSNTKTLTNIINVRSVSAPYWAPASESFENVAFFPNGDWMVVNEGGNTWSHTNSAAYTGSSSVMIYNYSGNVSGKTDNLISPGYNLTYVSGATLKFKMSYAVRATNSSDQLKVFATNNCGQFWSQRFSKSGASLATWGLVSTDFMPTQPNQWREETVSLSSALFSGNPNVMLKFEYTHDSGNNLYIDDINIDGLVGSEENSASFGLTLYPNPAKTTTRIEFTLYKDDFVTVKLLDVLGREIKTVAEGNLPPGLHYTEITDLETAGIYFVKLIIGTEEVVNKLVVR